MTCTFEVGHIVRFFYPAANYIGVKKRWEQRQLLIQEVRNLAERPLEPATLEADPLLDRGGTLVTGVDVDRGVVRSFYIKPEHQPEVVDVIKLQDPRPLKIAIVHNGRVKMAEMADPRQGFLEAFYRVDRPERAFPQPVSLATFFANSSRRAE